MKIYTKTGDHGDTSLFSGGRVPKHHQRVEAYGAVDELNAILGVVRSAQAKPANRYLAGSRPASAVSSRRRPGDPAGSQVEVDGASPAEPSPMAGRHHRPDDSRTGAAQAFHPAGRNSGGRPAARRADGLPPRRTGRCGLATGSPHRRLRPRLCQSAFRLALHAGPL